MEEGGVLSVHSETWRLSCIYQFAVKFSRHAVNTPASCRRGRDRRGHPWTLWDTSSCQPGTGPAPADPGAAGREAPPPEPGGKQRGHSWPPRIHPALHPESQLQPGTQLRARPPSPLAAGQPRDQVPGGERRGLSPSPLLASHRLECAPDDRTAEDPPGRRRREPGPC
ncbi:formin-like protein 5 isoform X1 [Choloepus didactylus]|uniref:formin-like protein 5 isoform X1 n=1 Tax=Choloepus didactylus TaxID=27675 RepID=UPI0018A02360|nr:formin-like protein 5 isoform X1 [Choloepus didactylus]